MATALKIKSDIKKLKAAINSKATPKSFLPKLNAQLEKAENELKTIQSGGVKKASTTTNTQKTLSALQKLVNTSKKYAIYRGHSVDLKKDSGEGAMKIGRRVSKGLTGNQYVSKNDAKGRVYYEYRPNRLDVKQPQKAQTYPKLAEGGMMEGQMSIFENSQMMAKGGRTRVIRGFSDDESYEYGNGGKMAKGGAIEHGLAVGDVVKLVSGYSIAIYNMRDKNSYKVNISKGERELITDIDYSKYEDGGMMAKGGKPRVTRGFSDDEEYEYGDGGNTSYNTHGEMHRNEQ
jgi:hypothetical protein